MSRSRTIEELVAHYIERRDSGEPLSVEAFLAENPTITGLEEALRNALAAEELFPGSGSGIGRPDRIGPWIVEAELGRGGAGRVLRVRHAQDSGVYALKLIALRSIGSRRARQRFRREGQLLSALDHPGIVGVHEVAMDGERPYIVMDYLPGLSLAVRLERARSRMSRVSRTGLPPLDQLELPGEGDPFQRAARIALELSLAVAHAHERGLLHRDLKPSNVVIGEDGRPVLVDFGLAVSEDSGTLTASGDLLGTPHYMAPEQARGLQADERTDVYGLGAVLYELLCLHPPHEGSDPLEILRSIRRRPHRPIRQANPSVPPSLARIVERALAWKRSRRTPTARLLAEDLEAFLSGRRPKARGRGPLEMAEDWVRYRPRTVLATSLAGLAIVAVATLGWLAGNRSNRDDLLRLGRQVDVAWLGERRDTFQRLADEYARLAPGQPRALLYQALGGGDLPKETGDDAVDALSAGLRAERAGDTEEAYRAYSRARRSAEGEWVLPGGMAALLERGGEHRQERIADLEVAWRSLPGCLRFSRELARQYRLAGNPAKGMRALERVLDGTQGGWRDYSELAACRLEAKQPAAAFEAIQKALERAAPDPPSSLISREAAILDALGEFADAEALFRKLVSRYPSDGRLHFSLGRVLDGQCRLSEARAEYLEAWERGARPLETAVSLAHLHAGSGMTAGGCESCRREFGAHPELLDPSLALTWLRRAAERDSFNSAWLPGFAADVAERAGCKQEVRALLADYLDEDAEIDARTVAIERALHRLAPQEALEDH